MKDREDAIPITLSMSELTLASNVGCLRQITAIRDNRNNAYGCIGDNEWQSHIMGAIGELAVAKAFGKYWSGTIGTITADGDVGPLQVRTRAENGRDLFLHRNDKDGSPFVLVTGAAPCLMLCGWIMGRDGKRPQFWRDFQTPGKSSYVVPQHELNPMASLPFIRGGNGGQKV